MNRPRSADFHVAGRSLAWSAQDRAAALAQAQSRDYPLVIIGGGITGAGVAREAALRGIPFLLVDREDFAFGTSSRSSKLVHGGMRYLAQKEFRLVRESTTERNWLCAALPNLVRPLAFHYCAYPGTRDTAKRVKTALRAYDLLGNAFSKYKLPRHRILTPAQLQESEPCMRTEGMELAGRYYDANVDDARLTLEVIKEARDFSGGRSLALNYVQLEDLVIEADRVTAVKLVDRVTDQVFTVRTGCVVNATGVWTSSILGLAGDRSEMIRPTKGVHLAVSNARLGNRAAFVLRSLDDDRNFFVLRRGEITLIGTTDTDYPGDLAAPFCTREDCDYLLRTVNARFPEAALGDADILSTYAGIRPLVRQEGVKESAISRRHTIRDEHNGLVTIVGGKLTTFRTMAWDVLSVCCRQGYLRPLKGKEKHRNFSRRPLKAGLTWTAFTAALAELGLAGAAPEPQLRHLHQQYGQAALTILQEIKADPESGQPFLDGHPYCPAEIRHILSFENAPTLMDVMLRRTEMQLMVSHLLQPELAAQVAAIMAAFYGWDEPRLRSEQAVYLEYIQRTVQFLAVGHD
jgi:glycerol-3-phosphate dehydrogenase